ncbi:MAG: DNA gyrase inhibitor YacG [Bdellovibrionales bacterium]|nr:DNA gyrase inhibitor YacG [Bdellovibrionales bacterium]
MKKQISCPKCGKKTHFTPKNPYRPFCSERCQLIDLGAWVEEEYRIPTENSANLDEIPTNEESDEDLHSSESTFLH